MTSIYQKALGSDFDKLHPEIQRRFGLCSEDGTASIGTGLMDDVWHGYPYTLPFLYVGTWRSIMFPARGRRVPFVIENYAYKDSFGRETVTWVRTFAFPNRTRRFDATMIYSEQRGLIVDYLGTHQHLAVDIEIEPATNGGVRIRSGAQRFYEGAIGFSFPMIFSGYADVYEWFDDVESCFRISVSVHNHYWGRLFGYEGRFNAFYSKGAPVPRHVKPVREEARE